MPVNQDVTKTQTELSLVRFGLSESVSRVHKKRKGFSKSKIKLLIEGISLDPNTQ